MSARDVVINLVTKKKGDGLAEVGKDLDDLGKKTEKTGGFFSSLSGKLSGFGDKVGKDLTGKLGPAGDAIDNVGGGLGEMSGKAALAGGAIAALGGFIAGGVGKLKGLYDNTRNFNEVAGTTWEEGSRLIAVFDDLRVSSDEGAAAMGKLTKTVGTSPEVLKQFGIEIVRAKDGTVDMTGTLENVATAFQQTTDPAKRAALGSALFGKSWQNMVPVLNQGGAALRKLVDGVDASQVATEKGAAQQDQLFQATDDLHDALDGLQRALAENIIPALAELARGGTTAVGAFSELQNAAQKLGPSFEEADKHHIDLKKTFDIFGTAAEHVGSQTGGFSAKLAQVAQAARDAHAVLSDLSGGLVNTQLRAKDAAKAFSDFEKNTKDLLQAQEDLRDAQRELEDTSLALEQAEIRAGDASQDLSDKAHIAEVAVRDHGAASKEAQVAVEEHRRAVVDARVALDGAADAAVANATKQAEASNTTLTAAERTKVYRDELIKLRAGVADPDLAAAMDADIERLRLVAEQAQSAAANLRGYNQAVAERAGIEREYGARDATGGAVTRRATGGPVWPGQQYLVHKDEVIRLPLGTGPGDVLSPPEAARQSSLANAFPSVRHNPDGTVQFGGDPATYPGSTVVGPVAATPVAYVPPPVPRPLGLGDTGGTSYSLSQSGYGGGGGTFTYNITVNGLVGNGDTFIAWLADALRKFDRARA